RQLLAQRLHARRAVAFHARQIHEQQFFRVFHTVPKTFRRHADHFAVQRKEFRRVCRLAVQPPDPCAMFAAQHGGGQPFAERRGFSGAFVPCVVRSFNSSRSENSGSRPSDSSHATLRQRCTARGGGISISASN